MAISTRDIKRRIRSITNTRKITKAMELVASAKMRRTVQAVLATRPYTDRAWDLLLDLARRTDPQGHVLLRQRPVKMIAIVLIASSRGLVGAFNTNLVNAALRTLADWSEPKPAVDFVLLGAKGRAIYTQYGQTVMAEFPKPEVVTNTRDISALSKLVIDGYINGDFDRVIVAFMDFESTLKQRPRLRQILPLGASEFERGEVGLVSNEEKDAAVQEEKVAPDNFEYLFEPDPEQVLETLLPRLVTMQLYRAVLETNASEQAARMMAMRNASDAADDLIDDLTLSFNQARQAGITQDLSEISAGRAALEQ